MTIFVHALNITLAMPLGRLVLRHAIWQIARNTTWAIVCCMHPRTRYGLVSIQQILALTKGIEKHRHRTDIQRVCTQPQQVIQDTGDFIEHNADVLCTQRHFHTH